MATKPEKQESQASIADIASTLLVQPKPEPETDLDDSQEVDDETPELEDDDSPTGGDDETSELEDSEDEDTGEEDLEEDDEEDDQSGETDYLDISDDDLITVLVDGEEQEVSIGDLKRAHSGEGAIEKRLQEATETRKAAIAERTRGLETLAAHEQALSEALDGLDDNLFKGVIPPPPDSLRKSNPDRYLQHREAYENDQARIKEAKELLEKAKTEAANRRQERLQEFAQEAAQVIAQEIPELTDPNKGQKVFKDMAETAMAYGYTQEEINSALDPRMFMLVRDAMRYRNMTDKTRERDPKDLTSQGQKKVRRLRSGNTNAKTRVRQADKQRKQVMERARQSGKPKDVAATLLVPKG